VAKKESEYYKKFREEWDRREAIIIALLASFPAYTWFESRSHKTNLLTNELDRQIHNALREFQIPVVKKAFKFINGRYGVRCEDIYWMLSCFFRYGETVGLSNAGLDFDYLIDREEGKLVKLRKKALNILGEKVFEQLKEYGAKKIKTKD